MNPPATEPGGSAGPAPTPATAADASSIWALIQGYTAYWSVATGVKLGLFSELTDGELTVATLAERLGAPPDRVELLVGGIVAAGFLERRGEVVGLSQAAARHLVAGEPGFMGELVVASPGPAENWPSLDATALGAAPPRDVGRDEAFYGGLIEATFPPQLAVARALAPQLIERVGRPGLRLLELGAGAAPFATAVLEADLNASAVVNDLAGVIGRAQAHLDAAGAASRVRFLPGDYFSVDLPPEDSDVVVLGHVCRAEGNEGARSLVGRAGGALAPGGVVVLTEYLLDDDRRGPAQALLLGATMLAATSAGTVATAGEALEWLRSAGLEPGPVTRPVPPTAVVLATKS